MIGKYYAIIPARSGSKGIADKNILNWGNTNILDHSVEEALRASIFENIIVSSDSVEYFKKVKSNEVIFHHRSSDLSTDTSKSIDVIKDIINTYNIPLENSFVVLLQPTSPLRNSVHIRDAICTFQMNCINRNISLASVSTPFNHSHTIKGIYDDLVDMNKDNNVRRQELLDEVAINGAIYISSVKNIFLRNSVFTSKTYPYRMNMIDSIDIDTLDEYIIAKLINEYSHGDSL